MKGLQPLFLGIFGIFAFSWLGMTVVPNLQIGGLNPQTDEDGGDAYPVPPSGMVVRGARVYAANGCVYCHSQQVRPEYGGSDIERHWGERRSAPRDYIFEPIVFLGKMRIGPDLANVGHPPTLQKEKAATPKSAPAAGASPAAGEPAPATAPPAGATPPTAAAASPATAAAPTLAATTAPAASPSSAANVAAPATSPAAGNQAAISIPTSLPAAIADVAGLTASGEPLPNTAPWHHRHLYNPRSISEDSNMPAYRFLYEKRRISGAGSFDSINFVGDEAEAPGEGWEIVPSYDAKCLVAYLMSRDQSHPLKEAKSPVTLAPAPGKEAQK
jgi:cbb3-type cytochrome oxidase cytochrome c subunit